MADDRREHAVDTMARALMANVTTAAVMHQTGRHLTHSAAGEVAQRVQAIAGEPPSADAVDAAYAYLSRYSCGTDGACTHSGTEEQS